MKERLDILLMKKSALTRNVCQSLIKDGLVKVNDITTVKCGEKFFYTDNITYEMPDTIYVSRGGYKLEKALKEFNIDLTNKTCLDIGASTGGFTDCMLQNNALKVYAVDTGKEQLSKTIKENEKVHSFENTNIIDICDDLSNVEIDFICVDVSFVSVTKLSTSIKKIMRENCQLIILIKPQFEAGRKYLNKNGIVKDKKIHTKVIYDVTTCFTNLGLTLNKVIPSPIKGSSGNEEYLVHFLY